MQEPFDSSRTQSPPPDDSRAEKPVEIHQVEVGQPGSIGDGSDAATDNIQTTSAAVADNRLSDTASAKPESIDSPNSEVNVTPMLELVRSATEPSEIFVTWLKQTEDAVPPRKISRESVMFGRTYETELADLWRDVQTLPPRLRNSLILPNSRQECGSTRELVDSIVALLRNHVPLGERDCSLVAYWSIATWFLDFLPLLPPLVVTGPALTADRLLQTLVAVCRRPLALVDVNAAVLLSLPLSGLKPTLLIRRPQESKRLAALLDASNQAGYLACRGKDFHELYCAKCIYIGEHARYPLLGPSSIHIHIGGKSRRVFPPYPSGEVIQDFQNKLLHYRFMWHDVVAASKFRVSEFQFRPEIAAIAQVLGAVLASEPDLQLGIMELLRERDEQSRVDRASGQDGTVLRAVLQHCHEASETKVFVRKIAATANHIYKEEGESLKISTETVGHVLKNLGLYTRRLGNAGRGLVLDKVTQARAHELGYANEVFSGSSDESACAYCHRLQLQQTQAVV